jgi:hypothetical protein
MKNETINTPANKSLWQQINQLSEKEYVEDITEEIEELQDLSFELELSSHSQKIPKLILFNILKNLKSARSDICNLTLKDKISEKNVSDLIN